MTDTIWHPDLTQFPGPKYLALTRALREAIRTGILAHGTQLPTVRDLAYLIGVTPGTVARAYHLATQEGMLAATVGRGTFVAAPAPRFGPTQALYTERLSDAASNMVDMRSPQLPDVGQGAAFAAAMHRVADRGMADWLDYPTQRSELPLRVAVANWLDDRILGPLTADDITLTYGGQNAVNLVFMCCLRGERPAVLIEDLAYPGFRHAARLSRADVIGVEMDQHGIRPDALHAACLRHAAQILCVTTEAQNPTTVRMPESRRTEIVAVARSHDLQIIEDECYSISESAIPGLRALAPERSWYIGSLSKTISPALRLGYIACPVGMGMTGRLTAQHGFFALARPLSDIAIEMFQSGEATALRRGVQIAFADRLAMMVNALGAFDLQWQPGLPFVWLQLPSGWRASTFTRVAEQEGVMVRSADEYALIHGRAPNAIRLAIAGAIPQEKFARALDVVARLLAYPPSDMAV